MKERRWWDIAMVTVSVLLAWVTALIDLPIDSREWASLGVIAVVLLAYFGWGRRYMHTQGSTLGLLYAGTLMVILGVGISIDPNFSFLQVVVFPTLWVVSRTLTQAIVLNALMVIPVTAGFMFYDGPDAFWNGLAVSVLSVAFSMAFGLWISSVERSGEERARLLDELLAVQDELAAANRDAGIDSERGRLAREIHDTIAQSLTGLVMVAQRTQRELKRATDAGSADATRAEALAGAAADVELMEQMGRDALTEARGLVAAISPVHVEAGLAETLVRLAGRFERETGVVVRTDVAALDHADGIALGAERDVVLLRCTQEALANVRKHSQATVASVSIARTADDVILTVNDDGVGPGRANEMGAASGFGLAGMADRLALVGGSVRLDAATPRGTRLTVTIPHADAATSALNDTGATA